MNEKAKNAVIVGLILIIASSGLMFKDYSEKVNQTLNDNIYSSLKITQKQLVNLRSELNQEPEQESRPA